MLRLVENRPDDWNRWIQESGSGFLQSWEWGEFQAAAGHGVRRYKVENDGEVLARFSLYLYALPFGQRYGFVPMGPVVAGEKVENFRRAIDELRKVVHQEGLVIARVEPFDNCSDRSVLKGLGLKPAPAFSPADTSIVDLSLEPDGLLAAMKPKTRYNIRLAEKRGVTVRQADPLDGATYAKDIASFQSLLAETARRDGFYTHVPDYYGRLLHKLAPNKSDEMSVRLFLAEHDGQPLAGALVSGFGDMATYLHGASSSEKRELMAPHQLHWQIMLWAKQAGFRKYDFWGVAPEGAAADHPWAGVTRFKLGFGGERKSYVGTWELPGHRFWYAAYRLAKRGR